MEVEADNKVVKIYYTMSVGLPGNPTYVFSNNGAGPDKVDDLTRCAMPSWKISYASSTGSGMAQLNLERGIFIFGSANLAGSEVGETTGSGYGARIILDDNAAGHGWYIDPTPLNNTDDFLPTSNPNVWQAKPDSNAAGKMDMLSVLLHEYGHALGIEHSVAVGDFMNATLQPGERRLPSPEELALMSQLVAQIKSAQSQAEQGKSQDLSALVAGASSVPNPGAPFAPLTLMGLLPLGFTRRSDVLRAASAAHTDNLTAINPTLIDASFDYGLANWETMGRVNVTGGTTSGSGSSVTLAESAVGTSGQTHLSQAFTLGANDRFLTFTISGLNLQNNGNTAQDAFEVAVINANTGAWSSPRWVANPFP